MTKVAGYNKRNMNKILYPNLDSAIRPVPHGPGLPIPSPPTSMDTFEFSEPEVSHESSESDYSECGTDSNPKPLTQAELNNLVKDLGLSKDAAQLLGSRLSENNLLAHGTSYSMYRNRDKDFREFFVEDGLMVFCKDIAGLVTKMGAQKYDSKQWRLFIDSSKRSLKAVLLHIGNELASIPIAYSVHLKETYSTMKLLLQNVKYEEHQWLVCGDFKVIGILLGQQTGYTKMPCYMCEWDSRAYHEHWSRREWPKRENLIAGSKNIVNEHLVNPDHILLPPLHIKLGLMKQYVKALDKTGNCFQYLCSQFPNLSDAKLKEGIFVGPDIRKLMSDEHFESTMTEIEQQAWRSLNNVVHRFLGQNKQPDYKEIVEDMLQSFKQLGCKVSLKLHFLMSHLDNFQDNLADTSEEHGERFHQELKTLEHRYQGRWGINMMSDYCWCITREGEVTHKRKDIKRSFTGKRKRK